MPVQYGTGAALQAQCPAFPPPPAGYVAWDTNVNGPIPADIIAHAKLLAGDMTKPLGYADTIYSGGVPLIVRVDAHTWTTDASGAAVAGCFHGADVFVPAPNSGVTPPSSSSGGSLFALSLALGVAASGLSIWEWLRK